MIYLPSTYSFSLVTVLIDGNFPLPALALKLLRIEKYYLTIGSCFSLHYQVMEHREVWRARKKRKSCSRSNSSFLSALQTSQVLHNSTVHS